MAPFYLECCHELNWNIDVDFLDKMKKENETKLKVILIRILIEFNYKTSNYDSKCFT